MNITDTHGRQAMKITLASITLVVTKGAVGWASDWTALGALVSAGFLRTEFYGPGTFGAVAYFITDAGTAAATVLETYDA